MINPLVEIAGTPTRGLSLRILRLIAEVIGETGRRRGGSVAKCL
jgi:hypothetical protein